MLASPPRPAVIRAPASRAKRKGREEGPQAQIPDQQAVDRAEHLQVVRERQGAELAGLLGMTPDEQTVLAHVARYHRGSPPNRVKHVEFGVDLGV